jgi:transposase-like protein
MLALLGACQFPLSTASQPFGLNFCQSTRVKTQSIEMALNGSGIRDTARVLKISPSTVIQELKKSAKAKGSQ